MRRPRPRPGRLATAMTLSVDDVRHVAMLARLGLELSEEAFYAEQLNGILAHIERLRQLDTEAIPPTAQVVELENRLREDEPRPGLGQARAVANAPEARDGFFIARQIREMEP